MTRVISCNEAVRRLWRFLDGELEAAEAGSVEDHLDQCVTCCGELEFARELRKLLDAQRAAGLPADVRDRLERFVDQLDDVPEAEASQ
ncbi:MAG: anti-sigma factor family protein [Acidimicrobiales bacterium]